MAEQPIRNPFQIHQEIPPFVFPQQTTIPIPRTLLGRLYTPGDQGTLVAVNLVARQRHPPKPEGGTWVVTRVNGSLPEGHKECYARAARTARMILPHHSGSLEPERTWLGETLAEDDLMGKSAWVVAKEEEGPRVERLGVCQLIGWYRQGLSQPTDWIIQAITPLRLDRADLLENPMAMVPEGAIVAIHRDAIEPIQHLSVVV